MAAMVPSTRSREAGRHDMLGCALVRDSLATYDDASSTPPREAETEEAR